MPGTDTPRLFQGAFRQLNNILWWFLLICTWQEVITYQYVARVRHYASDMPLNQAVKRAVDECIREGILAEFLARNRNEVISMSIFEYDKELEEKKLRKAEYEYGFAEGEKHAAIETAKRMLKTNNFSLEEIAARPFQVLCKR